MEDEKNPLFTELNSEESAAVSGGASRVGFDINTYLFILGAGVLFGNPGLTSEEIQFAWEQSFVSNKPSKSRRRKRFFWW
ncbi:MULTISPECIES: hypothetical protein [Nostocales]|uniref:Uncharacterized protein n=3 Tax=Nostocales TaxID=1161 RepID=A0A0C1N5W5_9CYAN|nr:hypothetical protein [Tolypothrix bouteillei]KAF3885927.1 hypothetical protein DA73_0400010940 [Tolypothrix bouteillei VB521301]